MEPVPSLHLLRVSSPVAAAVDLEHAIAGQLRLGPKVRPITIEASGGKPAPVWGDAAAGHLAPECVERLVRGEPASVLDLGHLLFHGVGSGPMFADAGDQLLEEAIVEVLAQHYAPAIAQACGLERGEVALFEDDQPQVGHPVAAGVAVERFATIASWLEGADVTVEDAAVHWALVLKRTPGEDRYRALADASGVGAGTQLGCMAVYLRGFMAQLHPSQFRYAALDAAFDAVQGRDPVRGVPANVERADWQEVTDAADAVILDGQPAAGAIDRALRDAALEGADVEAAVRRSLDFREYLWGARHVEMAERRAVLGVMDAAEAIAQADAGESEEKPKP